MAFSNTPASDIILPAINEVTSMIAKAMVDGNTEREQGLRDAMDAFVTRYDAYLQNIQDNFKQVQREMRQRWWDLVRGDRKRREG